MTGYRRRPVTFVSYGWWSLPGIVFHTVSALLAGFGAVVGTVFRWGWRYRSELAPLGCAAVVVYTGGWLHAHHSTWAPGVAALTVAVVASLAAVPRRWVWRWPWLYRTIERVYVCAVLAMAGGWLTAATLVGPHRPPLPALALAVTFVCAVPWWTHHRRRAKVRVERIIDGWPGVAEAAGLTGAAIVSALATVWGWTARVALPRGMTARTVIDRIPQIESGLGVRPGAVRIEPDSNHADRVTMRVIEHDPHAQPIGYPGAQPSTVSRPVMVGLFEDGSPVWVLLLRRNVLIGGIVDSGKSGIVNVILAALVACPDVVIWGIDLKGGMELSPWAPCLDRLATTPEQAIELLRDAIAELDARAEQQAGIGERLWKPTAQAPALMVVVDEYAELPREAAPLADSLVRRGRAVAVNLLAATQRPTQKAMGQGAVRSQMDVRIALRVRERADGDLILGTGSTGAGWHPDMLDAPGKFLISAREYTIAKPARAFHITDEDVADTVRQYAGRQPALRIRPTGPTSQAGTVVIPSTNAHGTDAPPIPRQPTRESARDPEEVLWLVLSDVPVDEGVGVTELAEIVQKSKRWVYRRLEQLKNEGRVIQPSWGRYAAITDPDQHGP